MKTTVKIVVAIAKKVRSLHCGHRFGCCNFPVFLPEPRSCISGAMGILVRNVLNAIYIC